ncbi:glutathione-dependent formaldehyde-activating enzyme protein [Fusarium austroafricanum]|uniref:Glutathione-dependent formaldehyde-activating enzyme protein n=1 Tax=Fusarium austroafricanum TaxID=2364996 RepID=A0A8H4KW27_9HYPO|nr:glutathione-dependent formaldehyde-activating enzyme protein [Fusarium austroafricanum]
MNPKIECQCGAIKITASQSEPISVYCCHCLECQKQSASAFGTSAIFPAEGIWPLPEDVLSKLGVWKRPTDKGNTLECYFCKTCGVRIFHRSIFPNGQAKSTISVKGGCVEGLSWEDAKHIYTRSARVPVPEGSTQSSPEV